MKKNKMMRLGSTLLVATLASTCVLGGTFAKYVTTANGTDSARVAKWGFTGGQTITLDNLFEKTYEGTEGNAGKNTVASETDVIAPGTEGSATFGFTYGGSNNAAAPEVAYTFKVDTEGSTIASEIENNKDIVWSLDDDTNYGTWAELLTAIQALDGSTNTDTDSAHLYMPGQLPDKFNTTGTNQHTIRWKWNFEDTAGNNSYTGDKKQDQYDTDMGNKTTLDGVTLKITVTATQID